MTALNSQDRARAAGGGLSARHAVFFVVAAAAPLGFAVGSTPLALGAGGIGTAGMFLVVGMFLAIFAAGYTAMARFIPDAGAFFSFIAVGIGRPPGLGAAFVAILAYAVAATASIGPFAVFASQATATFLGVGTPWQVWAGVAMAAMGVLGVLNVELNMRVLGLILLVEVALFAVLSVAIIGTGGAEGLSLHAFRPDTIAGGEIGVVLLVVFAAFAGFEATALFREEVRDPEGAIRRATYGAIGAIAIFHAVVTWAIIAAFGDAAAVQVAHDRPTDMFALAAGTHVGAGFADLLVLFVAGSWFASILAFHNATARYLFVLGRDGVIGRVFAARSAKTGAPWVASLSHTLFAAAVLLFCVVRDLDPYLDLFVIGCVPAAVSIPAMELLTACAIFAFFRRDRRGTGLWQGRIAPAISVAALGIIVCLVLTNLPMFTGRTGAINWILPGLNLMVFLAGIARAYWMRTHRPGDYHRIGRWGKE